jgi:hypothetical protein
MSKFLFLHSNQEPTDDIKVLDALGSVLFFRDNFLQQTYNEIFSKYDVLVLDVGVSTYRQWYSSYKSAISGTQNIKVIFLHPSHTHIEQKLMETLKNDWKVGAIIKEIPKLYSNRDDLINKLINNIHLGSLDLPVVESCFKSLLHAIAEKLSCKTG